MQRFGAERRCSMDADVRTQTRLLLALTLCVVLLALWALSGVAITSTLCKGTQQLTLYRGPLSSFCLRDLLSEQSTGTRESI
jgi:hypothetical protein